MKKYLFIIILFLLFSAGRSAKADFTFVFNDQKFTADSNTVASWQGQQTLSPNLLLAPQAPDLKSSLLASLGQNQTQPNPELNYNYELHGIYYYINDLAKQINQDSQEPKLTIENGRATDFTPPTTGIRLDVYQSTISALRALAVGKQTSDLTVYQTAPQNSLADTNNLGVNELVGEGVSNFKGSPNNRKHNIAAGIEKFKGLIIPQGAEFSFDDNLGPVTAEAGFLPELVIDNGTTLPELGGGLCQVSTTTFRAAMAAGLPITARRNHAYAVSYYSPQGTDATIYPGSADLKFINDTPGVILIWPYEKDANTLVFDFYGTKDSRQVTLEKPNVYDRKADGSMKADWTRVIIKDGQTSTSTFHSTYQPPALFHKTEQFVAAASPTPTPAGLQLPKTN